MTRVLLILLCVFHDLEISLYKYLYKIKKVSRFGFLDPLVKIFVSVDRAFQFYASWSCSLHDTNHERLNIESIYRIIYRYRYKIYNYTVIISFELDY